MLGLVDRVAAASGQDRRAVGAAWRPVAEVVVSGLSEGTVLDVLGLFQVAAVLREEQAFSHPITGQTLVMPAERVLVLAPVAELICAANAGWSLEDAEGLAAEAAALLHEATPVRVGPEDEDLAAGFVVALVDAVVEAAVRGEALVVHIDGLGDLTLDWRDGYILPSEDLGEPIVERGRHRLGLAPGLAVRAAIAV